MANHVAELARRRERARLGGGQARIDHQHKRGKLTARERLEVLLDPGSFEEFDMFVDHRCTDFGMENNRIPGDGVVTGSGTIDGRRYLCLTVRISRFLAARFPKRTPQKICKVMQQGDEGRCAGSAWPISGGARIQEGVASLGGYADVFQQNVLASGVIPQIA